MCKYVIDHIYETGIELVLQCTRAILVIFQCAQCFVVVSGNARKYV